VFQVWSANPADAPRSYTVEAGKRLDGTWAPGPGDHDLLVHGPNGFVRRFQGGHGRDRAHLDATTEEHGDDIRLTITNGCARRTTARVTDGYTGHRSERQLQPGASWTTHWSTNRVFGWYDLTVSAASGFVHHAAGHVEDGKDSASDPRMGGLVGRHP
jgi:phospholipase C